jgi:hypothetical protein
MDEYKQNECVICFEEFLVGTSIRKIPICKHIFHTPCIDSWIKSRSAEDNHKCPLCNTEITLLTLKKAVEEKKAYQLKSKMTMVPTEAGISPKQKPQNNPNLRPIK